MKTDLMRRRHGLLGTKKYLMHSTALAAGLFFALPAAAQQIDQSTEVAEFDEISVTGSRIRRSNMTSTAPMTVVNSQKIELSGKVNLVDMLQELPQMGQTANSNSTSGWIFEGGHAFNNLRNMGWQRTLNLVDGRRAIGSADGDGNLTFDISTIPTEMVERIEVVTGGASAVYGSDAIAGVVNFILKDDFEGLSINGQYGTSGQGDGDRWKTSITVGSNFADDKGNAVFHFAVDDQAELRTGDREQSRCGYRWRNKSEYVNEPEHDRTMSDCGWRWADWSENNVIWTPGDDWYNFDSSSQTLSLVGHEGQEGDDADSNIFRSWTKDTSLGAVPWATRIDVLGQRKYNGFANVKYNLTDSIEFKMQGRYSRTSQSSATEPVFHYWGGADISENPYASDELRAVAGDTIYFTKLYGEFGPRATTFTRQFFAISAGLEGEFSNGWYWDLYFKTGGTDQHQINRGQAHGDRWEQSRDVISDPTTGEAVCRDQSNGCVPFNIFGPVSQAAVDWVRIDQQEQKKSRQMVLSGSVSGDILELPAGPIGAAFGFEYRKDKLDYNPDSSYANGENLFGSLRTPFKAEDTVKEVYGELLVPIFKDAPMMKSLELELAARYADYEHHGGNTNWKAGLNWTINDSVRLRGIYATAKRAPSLGELFSPGSTGAQTVVDPCDNDEINETANRLANCRSIGIPEGWDSNLDLLRGTVKSSGNPNLEPEEAKTLTLGAVLTPSFLPDLSLSIDYFRIKMTNAIETLGASKTMELCYDASDLNNQACNNVIREANGDVSLIIDAGLNAAKQTVEGIDIAARYRFDLGSAGDLHLSTYASHLMTWVYQRDATDPASIDVDDGEYNDPKWRGNVEALWQYGDWTVNARWIWFQGGYVDNGHIDDNWYSHPKVPGHSYIDLSASYNIRENVKLYGGIDNVFDNKPPVHVNSFSGTGLYGDIGRYFYAGIKVDL